MENQSNGHVIDQKLMAKIEAIDLTNTRNRLITKKGMNPEEVDQAIADYRKFLYIVCTHEGKHEPTPIIDEVWHDHILHTEQYMQDCQKIAGGYIHHHPYTVEVDGKTCDYKPKVVNATCDYKPKVMEATCDASTTTCTPDVPVNSRPNPVPPPCTATPPDTACATDQVIKEKPYVGNFAEVMVAVFNRPVDYAQATCGQGDGCATGNPSCRCVP